MQNFYVDTLDTNLQIHSSTGAVDFWLQTPIEGLDGPDIRFTSYDKPGEDGGVASGLFYGGRLVTLRGIFKGSTAQQYEENRKRLSQAFAVRRSSTGLPVAIRCQFTTLGGSTYFFDAYPNRKPAFDWADVNWGRFLIQMYAPNPSLLSGVLRVSSQVTVPSGGGTTLPWTLPVTLGAPTSTGAALVTNNGTATAFPIIRLTGQLTNPQIVNTQNNLLMALDYTVATGTYVDIDMLEHTILLNGNSPILGTKADGSNWWGIASGETTLRLITDNSSDTGHVQLWFYDSWVGA